MNSAEVDRVFADLPPSRATGVTPFARVPFARDFRIDPRTARFHTVGQLPEIHAARHGLPAYIVPDSGNAATWAAAAGDVERPSDSSEAVVWREPAFTTPAELFVDLTADGVVRALPRVDLPLRRLAVVERLATYLRVVPTDREGVAVGPVFATTGAGDYDPFQVFVHPTDLSVLTVRWSLLGLNTADPNYNGVPGYMLPHEPIQIAAHWSDLRWGWGQRYTTGLQLEVPAGKTSVRLFATIGSSGAPGRVSAWRVSVGGRLGVWWISGGPRRAALHAAIHRTG